MTQETPMNTDPITDILTERGKTYGPFVDLAEIAQVLKDEIRAHIVKRKTDLSFDQQEALDMTCTKIARIVNGDPNHIDSWDDIAGYARLVADRLRGVIR